MPVPSGGKCAHLRKPNFLVSFMGVYIIRIYILISGQRIENFKLSQHAERRAVPGFFTTYFTTLSVSREPG